ncbi:MAG: APC family permease, partial [Sphingomonadaceae bacterium]
TAVGAVSFAAFSASEEPLAFILRALGHPLMATLIAGAAIVALPSVIMVMMYGQSRIFFVMARDGLLPGILSRVSPRTGTPVLITALTGCFIAGIAGFFRLDEIAELSNAGTLAAFISVAACMMILRLRSPEMERIFRCPLPWLVGPLAILGCLYLLVSLPALTIVRFLGWNAVGLCVYLLYGHRKSLARQAPLEAPTPALETGDA